MRQTLDAATRTAESEFVTVRKSGLKGLRNKIACLEKELRMAKRTIRGLASQTVDISGASVTMQAGGMPRRGHDLTKMETALRNGDVGSLTGTRGAGNE